jgi:hypothetical protein
VDKLKLWCPERSWEESEQAWDASAVAAAQERPIKELRQLPQLPGITPDTAKRLKWKSLKYMIQHDTDGSILRGFFLRPLKHAWAYLKSCFSSSSYVRDGDLFLYGLPNEAAFKQCLKDKEAIFVLGFSYCQKPFECPSGRFTPDCVHDATHPVCRQCFIGKCVHATPEEGSEVLLIPTVHYIGAKIFDIQKKYPGRPIIFLITACELTLEMFADWGNMVGIKGVGVRLDGRICNTMKAFELSERGVKPGLTVVLQETQKQMLEFIRLRRSCGKSAR